MKRYYSASSSSLFFSSRLQDAELHVQIRDHGGGLNADASIHALNWFYSGEPPKEPTYTYSGIVNDECHDLSFFFFRKCFFKTFR